MNLANLPGKWVDGVTAEMPAVRAAGVILQARLAPLPDLLEAAATHPEEDSEYVHQLRVWSRRSAAAIAAFRAYCPDTACREVRQQLRGLRRAAGAARADDVHFDTITRRFGNADDDLRPAIGHVLDSVARARRRAQRDILAAEHRYPPRQVSAARRRLLAGVTALGNDAELAGPNGHHGRPAYGGTLVELARPQIARVIEEFREASHQDLEHFENMHALRIAGKKLRYSTEIFAPCFGDEFKKGAYKQAEDVQDRLGELNDAHEMVERLERLIADLTRHTDSRSHRRVIKSGLQALRNQFIDERTERHQAFLHWRSLPGAFAFLDELAQQLDESPVGSPAGVRWDSVTTGGYYAARRRADLAARRQTPHNVRVAAIDVGTNSIRLVVAEADERTKFRVIEETKDTTRLGSGLYFTGRLKLQAIRDSLRALARMKAIAQKLHVSRIRAVATAAVREAANGRAFAELVKRRIGLTLETVDAEEEARLAHSSVANAFDLEHQRVAVADIGGGSTELVFGSHGLVDSIAKLPLGAVHLTEAYADPNEKGMYRYAEMDAAIDHTLRSNLPADTFHPEAIIGTGGTFTTLAKVSLRRGLFGGNEGRLPFNLRGYRLSCSEVRALLAWLRDLPLEQRRQVPGVSNRRAEIVVAGIAIVERLMEYLRVPCVFVHDGGIRDGLISQMIDESGFQTPPHPSRPSESVRQVRAFARQCNYEQAHSEHVTRLALQVFDQLALRSPQPPLWAGAENRELLQAAALLHDIGISISYRKHHKHSYDLIVKGHMPIFTPREIEVIANVARYHRRKPPSSDHANFRRLSNDDQRLVEHLAGILRIADGLDRTHAQNVRAVALHVDSRRVRFAVQSDEDPAVNMRYGKRKADVFEQAFGLRTKFRWRETPIPTTPKENPHE